MIILDFIRALKIRLSGFTQKESLDDIVFEKRNKEYGAYYLRKNYSKSLIIGTCTTIVLSVLFCTVQLYVSYFQQIKKRNLETIYNPIKLEQINISSAKQVLSETLKPAKLRRIQMNQENRVPVVVDSVIEKPLIIPDEHSQNTGTDADTSGTSVNGTEDGVEGGSQIIYYAVEKMPEFVGGDVGLRRYIAFNVKYPEMAKERGIEGVVYVKFCVTSEGSVDYVSILQGVDPLLDKEALRVIKELPNWTPGEQHGIKVSVWFNVPISFKLN